MLLLQLLQVVVLHPGGTVPVCRCHSLCESPAGASKDHSQLLRTVITRGLHVVRTLLTVWAHPQGIETQLLHIAHHFCGASPGASAILVLVLASLLEALL